MSNPMPSPQGGSPPESTSCGVVLITAPTEAEADAIAAALVEQRLAACVACFPMRSVYRWQGEVCREQEWQLLVKTDLRQFEALRSHVEALHSYDVPEMIAVPITHGAPPYLEWILQQVGATP